MSILSGLVGFAGSRSLPSVPARAGLVTRVVRSVVAEGRPITVGCAIGADAAVMTARMLLPFPESSSGPGMVVFSAFGPGGKGSWRGSAVPMVEQAASYRAPGGGTWAPVAVHWWAGGQEAIPLPTRLSMRTKVMCWTLRPWARSLIVVFFGYPGSRGSGLAAREAALAEVPVLAFPVGFNGEKLPTLMKGGRWIPAEGRGVWARAWKWAK